MILNEAIQIMTNEIVTVLADNKPTIYLFGSVALDDFQLGWSDIDILVLTDCENHRTTGGNAGWTSAGFAGTLSRQPVFSAV